MSAARRQGDQDGDNATGTARRNAASASILGPNALPHQHHQKIISAYSRNAATWQARATGDALGRRANSTQGEKKRSPCAGEARRPSIESGNSANVNPLLRRRYE